MSEEERLEVIEVSGVLEMNQEDMFFYENVFDETEDDEIKVKFCVMKYSRQL